MMTNMGRAVLMAVAAYTAFLLPLGVRAQKPVLSRTSCLFGAVCDDLRPCCSGDESDSVGQCCITDAGGTGAWGDGRAVGENCCGAECCKSDCCYHDHRGHTCLPMKCCNQHVDDGLAWEPCDHYFMWHKLNEPIPCSATPANGMNKHTDCIGIGECTGIGESWHGPGNNFGEEKCCMSDGYCNQWTIPVNCRECSAKEKQCTTGDKLLIDENGNYVRTAPSGESDLDCGGTICKRCADGRKCKSHSDCQTGNCDPITDRCAPWEVETGTRPWYGEQVPHHWMPPAKHPSPHETYVWATKSAAEGHVKVGDVVMVKDPADVLDVGTNLLWEWFADGAVAYATRPVLPLDPTSTRFSEALDDSQSKYRDTVHERTFDAAEDPMKVKLSEDLYGRDESIPISEFYYYPPDGYTVSLIVNPCNNHENDCCHDMFGAAEYFDFTNQKTQDASGADIIYQYSRLPDNEAYITKQCVRSTAGDADECWCMNGVKCCGVDTDPAKCTSDAAAAAEKREVTMRLYTEILTDGLHQTTAVECDPSCYDLHAGLTQYPVLPACWDNNATVDATLDCYNTTGDPGKTCVTIGYTSTAYVPECGGRFEGDDHCGVFIELHRIGDERVLADAKVPGGSWAFPSGYRMMRMPLTYLGDLDRVVCEGRYELWWVSRTRYNFMVEYRKPPVVILQRTFLD